MKFFKILILICLFSLPVNASEEYKIRFIDMEFIFNNSSVGKKISQIISNEKKSLDKKSKKSELNLKKQKDDILSKKNILDPKDFEAEVVSHQKEINEYQQEKQNNINSLNKKFVKLNGNFKKKVDKILVEYASQNKIDLIFNKKTIIVSNSSLDLTKEILKLVDEKIKKAE